MQDTYSLAKCEHYGRQLASRLCQQFFGPQPDATLDGPGLLQFTPVRQLNLLVLRQLLGRWQQEAQQLRSPYFNFEAEAVRTALTQFMNVLSRHIRLDRAALEPLLAQAAADTLLLAADPARAFERLLLPPDTDEPVPLSQLRDGLRYLDQDKDYYQSFVDGLPSSNASLSRDFLSQRFGLYQTKQPYPTEAMPRLVAVFSTLLPLTEADLRDDAPAPPAPSAAAAPKPAAPTPATPAASAAAPAPASSTPTPTTAPEEPASAGTLPLYEKLKATRATAISPLASTLRQSAQGVPTPLGERGVSKIVSLREAISINQRFSFINELFNGENMEYHAAIQYLDALPTAEAAMNHVRQELATTHDWSRKEEHVGKLLKLIERKFATAT